MCHKYRKATDVSANIEAEWIQGLSARYAGKSAQLWMGGVHSVVGTSCWSMLPPKCRPPASSQGLWERAVFRSFPGPLKTHPPQGDQKTGMSSTCVQCWGGGEEGKRRGASFRTKMAGRVWKSKRCLGRRLRETTSAGKWPHPLLCLSQSASNPSFSSMLI